MFLFFGPFFTYCFSFVLCMSTCDTTLTVMEVPLGYCIVCSWPVDLVSIQIIGCREDSTAFPMEH